MLITGAILLSVAIVAVAAIAKLGEVTTRAVDERRANKHAISLQRARERSAILADDARARRAAIRIARGGIRL